jgi:hypothetical protein
MVAAEHKVIFNGLVITAENNVTFDGYILTAKINYFRWFPPEPPSKITQSPKVVWDYFRWFGPSRRN